MFRLRRRAPIVEYVAGPQLHGGLARVERGRDRGPFDVVGVVVVTVVVGVGVGVVVVKCVVVRCVILVLRCWVQKFRMAGATAAQSRKLTLSPETTYADRMSFIRTKYGVSSDAAESDAASMPQLRCVVGYFAVHVSIVRVHV